ncbi:four-carbon acid sugar kinase family protein [Saccharomonospora sp. NPDC006951]
MTTRVLVIGDDLTGSNATGARFARAGLRTISVNGIERIARTEDADVVVVNIGTRQAPEQLARDLVREAAKAAGPVGLLAKRVDTTLRGNVGAELDALLDILPTGTRALVVPAFPDAGRTTVGGLHLVDGVPLAQTPAARDPLTPVRFSRVSTILRAGTHRDIAEVPLDVVESGVDAVADRLAESHEPVIVCDATTGAQLAVIAEAAARVSLREGFRWFSVDSGPFAVALASALGIGVHAAPLPPVLAVVGSITTVTDEQIAELEHVAGAAFVEVRPSADKPEDIAAKAGELLKQGKKVVGVRTRPPGPGERADPAVAAAVPGLLAEAAAILLATHDFGALYATGGDIAEATTAALGSDGFRIEAEVLPLAVAGRLVGGPHDGLPFATKGGLIGGKDAALACVEHLTSVIAQRERGMNR